VNTPQTLFSRGAGAITVPDNSGQYQASPGRFILTAPVLNPGSHAPIS